MNLGNVKDQVRTGVAVLLKVSAKCIDRQSQIAKRRIEDALGDPGEPEEDAPRETEGDG